ncbi:MAG: segregation/condensation protein A [Synergistaceae bacterium]|nr:segregation/condensation protein A [Synergistaceae bacterium]
MKLADLEIDIKGYSGPFDLLCSLVEDKKFRVSEIKISELIKIYGDYLIKTKQAPPDTLADFFYMSAGLLLAKTRSLLPGAEVYEPEDLPGQEEFIKSINRYKPYREAISKLTAMLETQSKCFRREVPQTIQTGEKEFVIDSDGAYALAKIWKDLNEKLSREIQQRIEFAEAMENADWDGFAETDQEQIDERIYELEELLQKNSSLSFNEICTSKSNCIVTLLALLELCRMGRAEFSQKELFSDVKISRKN